MTTVPWLGVRMVPGIAVALLCLSSCDSPTAPDSRTGIIALRVICDGSGATPLACRAETYCTGLYRCPDPSADGRDVTHQAAWSSEDSTVVRLVSPGKYESVSPGHTVIQAVLAGGSGESRQSVSVFAGTAPLPTNEIFGSVFEAGKTSSTGSINGATVEVLDGVVAGRTAVTGVPPQLLPGFFGSVGPGYYRLLGMPPGTYTVRIAAAGYVPQVRTVVVPVNASPSTPFELNRQ